MSNKMTSLDQQRAAFAWRMIEAQRAQARSWSDHSNLAKSLPALIMSSGLMGTLAFLQEKRGDQHRWASDVLRTWLAEQRIVAGSAYGQVMTDLHGGDSERYILATEESLELLKWLRQLAAAAGRGDG